MLPLDEPTSKEIQAGLNAVVRDTLRPAAGVLVIAYLCFTVARPWILPAASRNVMTAMAVASLVISLGLLGYLSRVEVPPSQAHHWAGFMLVLASTNLAVQVYLTPVPVLTTNILVMMVAFACFLLSHFWLAVTVTTCLLLWTGLIVLNPEADWFGTVPLVAVSVVVSIFVYSVRYQTYRRYERLRLEDARLKDELQQTTERLQRRLQLEHVLTQISARLLELSVEEMDLVIDEAMQAVGECFRVDHVCVARVDDNSSTFSITHEWCAPEVAPRKPLVQDIPTTSLPWCWQHFQVDQNVQIDSVAEMLGEAKTDQGYFQQTGICSFFALPLAMQGGTWGILALCMEKKHVNWSTETASLLRVLGEILVASLKRKEAAEEITDLNQRLEQASRLVALGEMAASLAHDLTNGLSAISLQTKGANRKAARGKLTLEKCEEYIQDIEKQADRLTTLLTTIQKFARNRTCEHVPLRFADVLRDLEILVGGKLHQKEVKLHWDDPSACPPLMGDLAQITLVIVNLVLNAAQAMTNTERDKRQITISFHNDQPEWIEVSIRDQGAGIPPELTEKIFEKFYTTKKEGLGLGLAFSRSYVEQHGGKLWCISEPGKGSDFRFTLPLPK